MNEYIRPGGPPTSSPAEISQAATTTKPGLRNSEGCNDANPSEYQRTAPLPKSVPKNGKPIRAMNDTKNPITAKRRTIRGDIIETANITIIAMPPKIACLVT